MRRAALALGLTFALLVGPARADDPGAEPIPVQPAAEIDPAPFTQALRLTVPASPSGVTRVLLGPAVLAAARADLGDVRVIDASRRQWPYVVRREGKREAIALAVSVTRPERGRSRHRLALEVGPAPIDALALRVDRAFYDRPYRLLAELADAPAPRAPVTLTAGRLARAAGAPEVAVIGFEPSRVAELALVIEDGDEAPLPITSAEAALWLPELRLVAPPGAYTLLTGDRRAAPPRYEIARLRDRVLSADAPLAELGPLGPSPLHRPPAPPDEGLPKSALWAVMALAIAALGWLALRLSRQEEAKGP